ncbi:MAG: PKD domain-containing protein [Methanoregula sp.]|nr:PKD domain-containing protein [Methanoregula sp.]
MKLHSVVNGRSEPAKMREMRMILIIVLLFLASLTSFTSALPNGTETPITTRPTAALGSAPAISGDKIVWEDIRDSFISQIYLYDLASGEEYPLNPSPNYQYHPSIYGNTVVWAEPDFLGSDSKIVNYDTTSLTRNEYNGYYDSMNYEYNYPKISGNTIVWQDYNVTNSNWDISVVRNSGLQPELIVYGDGDQKHPEIYQDYIVYENWTGNALNSPSDIWLYNLSTDTAVPVSEQFYQETFPHNYGEKIVWEATNLTDDKIHIHVFDKGAITRLTPLTATPFDQLHPSINDNKVVVEDYRRPVALPDIYLYDLLTGTETWVAPNNLSGSQMNPDIYDSRIVWADSRAGQSDQDIFLFTLGPAVACPAAGFSATPASGSPGLSVTFTETTQGTPVLYHSWNFSDGSPWSLNPVVPVTHQFVSAGIYPVKLTVGNALCRNISPDICKYKIYIDAPPEADFSAAPLYGFTPLTVHFTDTSCGGPKSWIWDFGDGTTSTEQNPSHVYNQPGFSYTVSLTVNNTFGSGITNTKTQTDYIRTLIGASEISVLPIKGITTDQRYRKPFVVYNGSLLSSYSADADWSFFASEPPEEYGWQNISFVSSDETGFNELANQTIIGNFSTVYFHTRDLTATNLTHQIGVNYKFSDTNYPARSTITSELWEGAIPADIATFEYFASLIPPTGSTTVSTIPFTARITKNPLFGQGTATINMSISSLWYDSIQETPTTPVIIIGTGYDSLGNTMGIGLKPTRNRAGDMDFFTAEVPLYFSTFGLAQVSGNGNPIQLLTLSVASHTGSGSGSEGGPVVVLTTPAPVITTPSLPDPGKTGKLYSNAQGVITQKTILQSTDGIATVSIGEGVLALDSEGNPLSSVTIKAIPQDTVPALPAGSPFTPLGETYDLQPDTCTFSPSVSLDFIVPQAHWGQDFMVKTYDRNDNTWQDVPTSYNPNTGIVSAQISHFCFFALFSKEVAPVQNRTVTNIPTQIPTSVVAPPPPTAMSTFSGMILWIIDMAVKNALLSAGLVILAVAVFLYGRKRRRDRIMYLL